MDEIRPEAGDGENRSMGMQGDDPAKTENPQGISIWTEVNGGITTFLTLSYILFVQPAVLSACGMDVSAVLVATCLASALGTILMGLFTNYPIALAPAMGHNFFFVSIVCGNTELTWQIALAANLVAGVIFLLLALAGAQSRLLNAVSSSLKNAIAVGIGMLIAFLGLEWSGLIVAHKDTLVTLGKLGSPPVLLSLFGLGIIACLMALRVRAAFLIGMALTALVGLAVNRCTAGSENPIPLVTYHGLVSWVPSLEPTWFAVDLPGLFHLGFRAAVTVILIFLFLDVFDTMGTLIGVGEQAGFVKDGKLPRSRGAFLADSIATVGGTLMGTSTVTSYVESAAGVSAGARTGLANYVTAALFLAALFFSPLVKTLSGGYVQENGLTLYPVLAPVLITVGFLMMKSVSRIGWEDFTEGFPAFLTICFMMFTFSITEGVAVGFTATALLKLVTGRGREVSWLIYGVSLLFLFRWIFL